MIDPERLKVLIALKNEGTVTAAAELLHITQPTASQRLKLLEEQTNATLVVKRGRGLVLTPEGIELATRGEALLAEFEQLQKQLHEYTRLERGLLKMASFPSATAVIVPKIISTLAERHPGLTLDVIDAEPPDAAALLETGAADIALVFSHHGGYQDAEWQEELFVESLNLVTSATEAASISNIKDLQHQIWHPGCPRCRTFLLGACAEAGFEPKLGYASDDYVAVQALISAGHGVAILPELALKAHLNPGVQAIAIPGASRSVRIITRGAPPHPPATEAVINAARSAARAAMYVKLSQRRKP